jgi:hypothetical protein
LRERRVFAFDFNNKGDNIMNKGKTVLAVVAGLVLSSGGLLLSGCATHEAGTDKLVYREEQFKSRLEYLRFCQRYELLTYRCPDLT